MIIPVPIMLNEICIVEGRMKVNFEWVENSFIKMRNKGKNFTD